jgi:hypothetical protein
MNGQQLPVMADFVECLGLVDIIRAAGEDPRQNFEAAYSSIHRQGLGDVISELDSRTRTYFGRLLLPDEPTIYDLLVLSLREKDMIVTFNWDPLLVQAYKRWRHLGAVLPELVFLHGNVDVGADVEKKVFGFLSDEPYPGRILVATPLLYPVEQKNYEADPFIEDQWKRATDCIAHAYYITIFGYSAPTTDVEARSLLLNAWKDNTTRELAQITMIDIRNAEDVERSWSDFIVRDHSGGVLPSFAGNILSRHPRRSCESFAFSTLQQAPWKEDRLPEFRSRAELEAWIKPLIEEEGTGKLSGKPHHN